MSFNANPVTMAAGLVATEMLTPDAISRLNALGDLQRREMKKALDDLRVMAKMTGVGSLCTMYFTDKDVKDFREFASAKKSLNAPLHISLLNEGVSVAPRLMTALSTPMSEREIYLFIDAFRKSIELLRPLIKQTAANLFFT